MDAIIDAFGLDLKLIIIQVVNFGILMAALVYFLYKPVLNLLAERAKRIEQGLKDAEEAAAAKQAAATEKQAVLSAAHQEAEAVNERAKTAAEIKAAEILAAAEIKAADLVKSAEARGESLKTEAIKESERAVAEMAILATEKILRERA